MATEQDLKNNDVLSVLLRLEEGARNREDLLSLHYFIVNETRRLLHYRHAVLFKATGRKKTCFQAIRTSGATLVDRAVPRIRWLEQVVNELVKKNPDDQLVKIVFEELPEPLQQDWQNFSLHYPVWIPLKLPDGFLIGSLWLERESVWNEDELHLAKRIAGLYAHAWGYFDKHRRLKSWLFSRKRFWTLGILLIIVLMLPVKHTTLGPVTVVAKDPLIVSAPIDGVIASIPVKPNQMVKNGLTLLTFEDTNYRNEYAVAAQTLAVAQAELKNAMQGAFQDQKSKAEVALLKAKVDLARIKRDYAKEMLEHVNVSAEKEGIVLFNDQSELIGRPVSTGERLMEIARTGKLMLRIELPVENNIELSLGAPVKVYLDINPVHSIDAKITYISFRAEVAPGNILVYRLEAEFTEHIENLRIGWQGTAKIYGESVHLFFYLFRRPLAAARQYLGF